MKAEIKGILFEGTPEELSDFLNLQTPHPSTLSQPKPRRTPITNTLPPFVKSITPAGGRRWNYKSIATAAIRAGVNPSKHGALYHFLIPILGQPSPSGKMIKKVKRFMQAATRQTKPTPTVRHKTYTIHNYAALAVKYLNLPQPRPSYSQFLTGEFGYSPIKDQVSLFNSALDKAVTSKMTPLVH